MATFKVLIRKDKQRADKTWNVVIRFTNNRQVRYISTSEYVTKKDLTSSMNIKNQQILDKCNRLILEYRERISKMNLEIHHIDIDSIVRYITTKEDSQGLSFTEYAKKWLAESQKKGVANYRVAFNSFCRFCRHDNILFDEMTVNLMKAFEESLQEYSRAQSLYPNAILKIFHDARDYYNDEDNGIIRIKQTLSKYHPQKQKTSEKRALSKEIIRKIFSLPYKPNRTRTRTSRYNLALDCFRLSFCLMGINTADLYNATEYKDGYIIYDRTKTKDRRADKAHMEIKIHPIIFHLVEKYKGDSHAFNFYKRFRKIGDFNKSVNIGLKEVGGDIGVDGLQFYSARHSMATIALNDVRIDKWLVNEMLCHIDPTTRITDIYIKKDFAPINEANFKLIDYMFGEAE